MLDFCDPVTPPENCWPPGRTGECYSEWHLFRASSSHCYLNHQIGWHTSKGLEPKDRVAEKERQGSVPVVGRWWLSGPGWSGTWHKTLPIKVSLFAKKRYGFSDNAPSYSTGSSIIGSQQRLLFKMLELPFVCKPKRWLLRMGFIFRQKKGSFNFAVNINNDFFLHAAKDNRVYRGTFMWSGSANYFKGKIKTKTAV